MSEKGEHCDGDVQVPGQEMPPAAEHVAEYLQIVDLNVVQPGNPMLSVCIAHPEYYGKSVRARFCRN